MKKLFALFIAVLVLAAALLFTPLALRSDYVRTDAILTKAIADSVASGAGISVAYGENEAVFDGEEAEYLRRVFNITERRLVFRCPEGENVALIRLEGLEITVAQPDADADVCYVRYVSEGRTRVYKIEDYNVLERLAAYYFPDAS